jgi:preprotein translocase subunit SecA
MRKANLFGGYGPIEVRGINETVVKALSAVLNAKQHERAQVLSLQARWEVYTHTNMAGRGGY